jgi:hypothetical protein
MKPDAEFYEVKTEVAILFPASGSSDLADPWNGRTVIPETVRLYLCRRETPEDSGREQAFVSVTGPRRLKSGGRGQEIASIGWEAAFPEGPRGTFWTRPDWLTELLADHLPEGWSPSLLDLNGGAA